MKINFITLNIWNGGQLFDNAIEFLLRQDPDILVLQEVNDGHDQGRDRKFRTMEVLHEALPSLKYSAFGGTIVDHGNGDVPWGNAVFSRFPIVSQRNVLFSDKIGDFNFVTRNDFQNVVQGMMGATIDIEGRTIDVYSLHGVWGTHGDDTEERTAMGEKIIESLKGVAPLILAGDTNLNPTTEFVKKVCNELSLVNVFGTELTSTFNLKHKDPKATGYASAAVDMIMASSQFTVVSKDMPQVDVSDHYPLQVLLEV